MPLPKPLTKDQANRTLAHRFARRADRLRQFSTRFGLRSDRVFLVWTKYRGEERGAGDEVEVRRMELLPTPKVGDQTAVALNPYSGGVLPVGSVRVSLISATLTEDELLGKVIPAADGEGETIEQPYDFFWEIVDDGRAGERQGRDKYRVIGTPERDEGNVSWSVVLDRISEDRDEDGSSNIGWEEDC